MHGALLTRLVMNIQNAYVLVVQDHLVVRSVHFRRILRFRYNHGEDRDAENWNEFLHY